MNIIARMSNQLIIFFYWYSSLTWPPRSRASSPPRSCTLSPSAAWWCGSDRIGSHPPWRRRAPRWVGCVARWRCLWWREHRPCSPGCRFVSPGWVIVGSSWSGAPEEVEEERGRMQTTPRCWGGTPVKLWSSALPLSAFQNRRMLTAYGKCLSFLCPSKSTVHITVVVVKGLD